MRVIHLAAGAGLMYCGACARDVVLARGMQALGHDFRIVPLYTPLKVDGDDPGTPDAIFLGGINAWLQQHSGVFRILPPSWDRPLDNPALLHWASLFAVRTDPKKLGAMTVSVLAGQEGRQRKEITRLLDHLAQEPRPDVFSLSNSLLSGLAPALKQRFDLPVLCGLQGEEGFIASLPEKYRKQALALMQANARAVDVFLSPGERYGAEMAAYLNVPPERLATARPGIELDRFRRPGPRPTQPFVIGYLSVIIPRKGLDLLVKAWLKLVGEGRDIRLRVGGRALSPGYLKSIRRTIAQAGLSDRCEFVEEVAPAEKANFLLGCSAFAVPSRFGESKGLAVLEAMAAGVPVVMPDTGIYPELVELFGCGRLHTSGDADSLADGIRQIMLDPAQADADAAQVLAGLKQHYSVEVTTRRAIELFESVRS